MADLSKDDLILLMESYKNMIQLNTTLIEQQKAILYKQETILDKQNVVCDKLDRLLSKLDNSFLCIKDRVGELDKNCIKDHASIRNRLYISVGLMTTIILGLLGILGTLLSKVTLLNEIAKYLGVLK